MKEAVKDNKQGKPWNIIARFASYIEADNKRNELISSWEAGKQPGMQAKVKRTSAGVFMVKTRLHPDFEPKVSEKKKTRTKKRNKKVLKENDE